MKSTIICIGRQYGSGGREIGEKLAKRLGITCYDKLLIQHAAQDAGLAEEAVAENDEKPIGLCAMVSGNPFADIAALSKAFYSEEQRVFEAERQAILEIAAKGSCILIGRCASSVLRSLDYDILSVFVYADNDDRARRISERNGISEKAAAHKAAKVDRMRKRYFDFYSDTPWGETASYDLMISSSRYGIDGTVDVLARAVADKVSEENEK